MCKGLVIEVTGFELQCLRRSINKKSSTSKDEKIVQESKTTYCAYRSSTNSQIIR
jgi:hypothetical protein